MHSNEYISIVVPVKNNKKNLSDLLSSLTQQTYKKFEVIINNDKVSTENMEAVVPIFQNQGLQIVYLIENIGMAQGRKSGAKHAKGTILMHIDSDMKLESTLLEECANLMGKYDALVIPEESFGTTFWAKCKWLEKKCYDEVPEIESLRVIKKEIYDKLGGHDEELLFSEDKDLDIRVHKAGYKVGRTKSKILHNEGNLSLWKTCLKKLSYAPSSNKFFEKHPKEALWQSNIFNRYGIFFKNIKYLSRYPLVYCGMIFMKTCEFGFGFLGLIISKLR